MARVRPSGTISSGAWRACGPSGTVSSGARAAVRPSGRPGRLPRGWGSPSHRTFSSERTIQNTENSPKVLLIRLPMSPGPRDSPALAGHGPVVCRGAGAVGAPLKVAVAPEPPPKSGGSCSASLLVLMLTHMATSRLFGAFRGNL